MLDRFEIPSTSTQQFSFWRGSRHSGMDCRNPVPWTVSCRLRKRLIKRCELTQVSRPCDWIPASRQE